MSPPPQPMPPDRAPRAKKRGARLLRLAVIFITTVALVDALVGDKGLIATMRARREYTELTARLARMRLENAGLRESARRLREDPDAIEELARRELGLIRVGETLFIIRDVAPAGSSPTPAPLDDER